MKRLSRFQAVFISIIIAFILISQISFPLKVNAIIVVPVDEENPTVVLGEADNTRSLIQDLFEWSKTFVLANLRKQLLDYLVDQTVAYIQGGGKPQFVTDWKGFLTDAGDRAAGEAISQIGKLNFLCEPFSAQIQIALLPEAQQFSKRAQCTLTNVVGNITDFANDFRNGGWIGYAEAWQPKNNVFGALLLAQAEVQRQRQEAVGALLLESLAGGGFLSPKDEDGNIITPGKTVGDALAKAVGSDIDYVLSAEQLSDYVSAITNALINRIIKAGVSGAQSASSQSRRDEAAAQNESITANNFEFAKNSILNQINQTLEPRQDANSIIESAIAALNSFKSQLNTLLNSFNNLSGQVCSAQPPLYPTPVNVNNTKSAISSEIAEADNNIAQLQAEKSNNQIIIDELTAAKSQIEPLTANNSDMVELTSINNSVADILDPNGSANFKTAMEEQSNTINQNIESKLGEFNSKLQQCQLTP